MAKHQESIPDSTPDSIGEPSEGPVVSRDGAGDRPPDTPASFGPGFTATFLYYFSSAAIASTFIASTGLGLSLSTGIPQKLGLLVGVFAGLVGGYFNRTVSFSVAFRQRSQFLAQLDDALEAMGYALSEEDQEGVRLYERSPLRRLVSGKLFVKLDGNTATIASRSIHIMALRRRLQ